MPLRRAAILLMLIGCSPADTDAPPVIESAVESATDGAASDRGTAPGEAPSSVGTTGAPTAGAELGQPAGPACVPPEGPLAGDASLESRAGAYHLTMVEEVDGSAARRAEGSLTLLTQAESLRQFAGSAGGAIPGVTSPLFGSTDVNVESVGAVRVGSLSSEDPDSPGVLVIESDTGAGPSILLRLGSDANRRDLVRFDGGFTVLNVVEIAPESFSGTWSSGALGPGAEGFFCARPG